MSGAVNFELLKYCNYFTSIIWLSWPQIQACRSYFTIFWDVEYERKICALSVLLCSSCLHLRPFQNVLNGSSEKTLNITKQVDSIEKIII